MQYSCFSCAHCFSCCLSNFLRRIGARGIKLIGILSEYSPEEVPKLEWQDDDDDDDKGTEVVVKLWFVYILIFAQF